MENVINIIKFAVPQTGNFLVDIIIWLVQISSSISVGIILFTLILKLITLPFDFISRASMRKNNLKMEAMRPELEKLKQQYGHDKNLYNQKMMALYKKNGYSMMASCLPTIFTLVIFIVAISGFNNYSTYQNRQNFYSMSLSYNSAIYAGIEKDYSDNKYVIYNDSNNTIEFNDDAIIKKASNGEEIIGKDKNGSDINYLVSIDASKNTYSITSPNGYLSVIHTYTLEGEKYVVNTQTLNVVEGKLAGGNTNPMACEENNYLTLADGKTYGDFTTTEEGSKPVLFIQNLAQEKSAETFREENEGFLWIKNIWVSDTSFNHPIEQSWNTFKSAQGYNDKEVNQNMDEAKYNQLIKKLDYEKTAPNGYFILIILSAGVSFLTQFVMSKSQKTQNEFQSADGQSALSGKMMMWMMPIMMTVFAFMYTSAFSIYIVLSSLISLLTTLGINAIVDYRYKKGKYDVKDTESKGPTADNKKEVIRGRVYTPKEEPKTKDKKKSKDKKEKNTQRDFIGSEAKTNESGTLLNNKK